MRHVTLGNFTLDHICEVRILRGQEKNFKDPDPSEAPKIQDTNFPKTLEAIDLWISKQRDTVKAPLGYVMRNEPVVKDLKDPRFGKADSPCHNHNDKMVVWALNSKITSRNPLRKSIPKTITVFGRYSQICTNYTNVG